MSSPEARSINEIEVDRDNLYREEIYTDLKVGSIRHLVPVKPDGSPDPSRDHLFMGQTQLLSHAGPVPVSCAIEAATLEEALDKFPEALNEAVERLIEEAREIQRQEASRIVVPTMAPPGSGIGGPGGGKIIP